MRRSNRYDELFIEKIDRLSFVSPSHFGDVCGEGNANEKQRMNSGTKQIYELLKMIPEKETVTQLESLFPSLVPIFANAKQVELYHLSSLFVKGVNDT